MYSIATRKTQDFLNQWDRQAAVQFEKRDEKEKKSGWGI
jgi:hypothetical protein